MSDAANTNGHGPVPVRDLLKRLAPESAPTGEDVGPPAVRFEADGVVWLARVAGAGCYGTGRVGAARVAAIQFFREQEPDRPVREALVPAGALEALEPAGLRALLDRATPIVERRT